MAVRKVRKPWEMAAALLSGRTTGQRMLVVSSTIIKQN